MARGRTPWQPTEKQLKVIEEMSKKGSPQKAIYGALGVSCHTWKKYRDGESISSNNNSISSISSTPIKKALEKGIEARTKMLAEAAEDALYKLLTGEDTEEVHTTTETSSMGKRTIEKTIKKRVQPNATVAMFMAVNTMPDRFQSINKVEVKQENNQTVKPPVINWTKPKG